MGDRGYFGPKFIKEARAQVSIIRSHLKAAQSRQKTYADKRRRPLEFTAGDYVYLKMSPMRGVHWFGIHGKLAPRYVGPYRVLEQCGPVAYHLWLPAILSAIHNVFQMKLWKLKGFPSS